MAKVGDYQFLDFQDGEKVTFEVRVTLDANGVSKGFIKKLSDTHGNYIYNYYDIKGAIFKQDTHFPNNPAIIQRFYENIPNLGSLEFVLALLRDNEALQMKYDNILSVVVEQADKLRVYNNENLLNELSEKVQELAKAMPQESGPDDSPPDDAPAMDIGDMFGMEPF